MAAARCRQGPHSAGACCSKQRADGFASRQRKLSREAFPAFVLEALRDAGQVEVLLRRAGCSALLRSRGQWRRCSPGPALGSVDLVVDAGELAANGFVMNLANFRWDALGKVEELLRLLASSLSLLRVDGIFRLQLDGSDVPEFLVSFVTAFPVKVNTRQSGWDFVVLEPVTSEHLDQVLQSQVWEERSHERYARLLRPIIGSVGTVLDVGGGDGHMAQWWSELGCQVYLLETDVACAADARRCLGEERVVFHDGKSAWPYADGAFDLCLLLFVLHHIAEDLGTTLREAARVSKKVLVLEDQPRAAQSPNLARLAAAVTAEHFRPFGQNPQTYMRFIRPDSLWRQLFAEAELHVVRQVEIPGTLQHPVPHTLYELSSGKSGDVILGANKSFRRLHPLRAGAADRWARSHGHCLQLRDFLGAAQTLLCRAAESQGPESPRLLSPTSTRSLGDERQPRRTRRSSSELDSHPLRRFSVPQKTVYSRALREIGNGQKESCWMWFLIPTPPYVVDGKERGSIRNQRYALRSDEEVREYLRFEEDGVNLRDNYLGLMRAIREQLRNGCKAIGLLGVVDEPKLRSSASRLHGVLVEVQQLIGDQPN
ncbi:unnamed protein product [Effrenium voratum]|nr:unnamed protein product [Effrenium voratum]